MRLLSLTLENIGPFDTAELSFLDGPEDEVPVTFITGENGTGKSIVLDAIRGCSDQPMQRSSVRSFARTYPS